MQRHGRHTALPALTVLTLIGWAVPSFSQQPAAVAMTSAANYEPVITPDSLASVFGSGFSNGVAQGTLDGAGNLPVSLGGVTVEINGREAGLIVVAPGQINLWVPPATETGEATVVVKRGDGTILGEGRVDVQRTAPALFALDASGSGPGAVLNAVTFALGPFTLETAENPASDKRTRLSLFGTGIRLAGTAGDDGGPAGGAGVRAANVAEFVKAQVVRDGVSEDVAVEYAGEAPGFFGFDQVNLVLSETLAGEAILTLTVSIGDQVSNAVTVELLSSVAPQVDSFTPAAVPPGGKITINGSFLARGAELGRTRIIFDAGGGLSAAALPSAGDATMLEASVPPIAADAEAAWHAGPVTLCVETDGLRTCAPQPLTIQEPAAVAGAPGDLLLDLAERMNNAALDAVGIVGDQQQLADLQQISTQALADLRQKVADALAGTPQSTSVTLDDGQVITVEFDLAAMQRIESLMSASESNLGNAIRALEEQAAKMKRRAARRSAIDFDLEADLQQAKDLRDAAEAAGEALAAVQMGVAGGAIATCIAFPPACPFAVAAMTQMAPVFAGASIMQVVGVLIIDAQPNTLTGLSVSPTRQAVVPFGGSLPLTVSGRFASSFDSTIVLADMVSVIISKWMIHGIGLGSLESVLQKILKPVVGLIVNSMLDLGLRDHLRIPIASFRDVELSWNTVTSNCIRGSSPQPGMSFFLGTWTLLGLEPMRNSERCDLRARDNIRWLRGTAPTSSITVKVGPDEPSGCALSPVGLTPFESVYSVSDPIGNGDRVVVGAPASFSSDITSFLIQGTNRYWSLRLPRFTNERFCSTVTLAPGCTADAYVPTQSERSGNFGPFAIIDPFSGLPFPGGVIPISMMGPGGVHAWRVKSLQGCGP